MPSISINIPKALSNAYRAMGSSSPSSASSSPPKDSFFTASSHSSTTSVDSTELYVPVHKRSGSNPPPTKHSHICSRDALLALADSTNLPLHDSICSTLHETCPEIVMNRKMRKAIEYKRNHVEVVEEKKELGPTLSPEPQGRTVVLPMFRRSLALSEVEHSRTGVVTAMRKPASEPKRKTGVPSALRNPNARRNRAVGRSSERRKNALKAVSEDVNWRMRSGPLPVPQILNRFVG